MGSTVTLVVFGCTLALAILWPICGMTLPHQENNAAVALKIGYLRVMHEDTKNTFESHMRDQDTSINSPILVNLTKAVTEVSDQFLSVTIDACAMWENWTIINFTSPSVINLAKGLYPAMLRLGGTPEDFVIFKPNAQKRHPVVESYGSQRGTAQTAVNQTEVLKNCYPKKFVNFTMDAAQWDAVNEFVRVTGWDFIYGLNVLLRTPEGAWNYTNPEELMRYTASKGYPINWELGNEPMNFPRVAGFSIAPEQLAKDFAALKALKEDITPSAMYLAGPDTGSLSKDYAKQFLESIEDGIINAATYHHYYTNAQSATLPDFFSVHLLDSFISEAISVRNTLDKFLPGVELWLGETSTATGGGAPGLSDAYVAGFMWLDKLGIAAVMNHTRVLRQSFVGVRYSLLDSDQKPLPDYWLSAVYKKLVGTRVLYVFSSLESGRYIRAYAHCAKSPYPAGSVVLLLLNINTYDTNATLANTELASSSRDVYWLTPPGNSTNVLSQQVTLNGHLLQLVDNQLPELQPERQAAGNSIFLPALSFGFYVFKDVKAPACTY